jgi:hypothetical protein
MDLRIFFDNGAALDRCRGLVDFFYGTAQYPIRQLLSRLDLSRYWATSAAFAIGQLVEDQRNPHIDHHR